MSTSLDTVRSLLKHNPWDKNGNDSDNKSQEQQSYHTPNEDHKLDARMNRDRIEAMLRPREGNQPTLLQPELPREHDNHKVIAKGVVDREKPAWPDAEQKLKDLEAFFLSLK